MLSKMDYLFSLAGRLGYLEFIRWDCLKVSTLLRCEKDRIERRLLIECYLKF